MAALTFTIINAHSGAIREKHYSADLTVGELKQKLVLLMGIECEHMKLEFETDDKVWRRLDDDRARLCDVGLENNAHLKVSDVSPNAVRFDDLSQVQKYEMDDSEYDKRGDSVREFKRMHGLGRFAEGQEETVKSKESDTKSLTDSMKIGDRCEIRKDGAPTRRGAIRYIGTTNFQPGMWVGVEYDEPFGKNDGSVNGERYFNCSMKYGGFIRPTHVTVGDFPPEDDDLDITDDDEL